MATYRFHSLAGGLMITDTPVGYNPPVGPAVRFTASYIQRDSFMPALPYFVNLGPKWTFDWISYVEDDPSQVQQQTILAFGRGGGVQQYPYSSADTYGPYFKNHAVLKRTSPTSYELQNQRRRCQISNLSRSHRSLHLANPRSFQLQGIVDD